MSKSRQPQQPKRVDQYRLSPRKLESSLPADPLTRIWADADDRDPGAAAAAVEAIRASHREQGRKR
jgi:hypothetical protein